MQDLFIGQRTQDEWNRLNVRYFSGALPAIQIAWSPRLTASAGMFVSQVGPRARQDGVVDTRPGRRLIRLSLPLLRDQPEEEMIATLAHEMIHQWQYDILKRRPNHGRDFRRLMEVMNRDGLGVTIGHSLDEAVQRLAKYAWRCQQCGRDYRRQRRTIRPSRHRCGVCRGKLRELLPAEVQGQDIRSKNLEPQKSRSVEERFTQLTLDFSIS